MNETNLQKSIVLIGPKSVGKSLITKRLAERLKDYVIFSSDELENLCALIDMGNFKNAEEIKKEYIDEFRRNYKKQKYDTEELKSRSEKHLEESLQLIDFFFDNFDLKKLVQMMNETRKILCARPNLTEKQMLYLLQYRKIKLLEEALSQIDKPLLCDFGADIGAVIGLYGVEQLRITEALNKPFKNIEKTQKKFFERFASVVYLEPGIDYDQKVDPRWNDRHNKLYTANRESYVAFANFMVSMNGTFYELGNEVFKNDSMIDFRSIIEKEKLMDKANLDSICDQIEKGINDLRELKNMQ